MFHFFIISLKNKTYRHQTLQTPDIDLLKSINLFLYLRFKPINDTKQWN